MKSKEEQVSRRFRRQFARYSKKHSRSSSSKELTIVEKGYVICKQNKVRQTCVLHSVLYKRREMRDRRPSSEGRARQFHPQSSLTPLAAAKKSIFNNELINYSSKFTSLVQPTRQKLFVRSFEYIFGNTTQTTTKKRFFIDERRTRKENRAIKFSFPQRKRDEKRLIE